MNSNSSKVSSERDEFEGRRGMLARLVGRLLVDCFLESLAVFVLLEVFYYLFLAMVYVFFTLIEFL